MDLNPEQRSAVEHLEGPLLILAGAGSGKTRVLVGRIARLIADGAARPDEILAVTFTNKAARELVGRCRRLVGDAASRLWAGTFHGIGARLLRRHADVLGYPRDFSIFDTDDQMRLVRQIVAERRLDEQLFSPEAVRAFIDAAKNEARRPSDCAALPGDVFAERAAEVYADYQRRLATLGAMDFGDLIVNVLELFRRSPDLLERYQRRFRYLHVDEYQDTNHAQYLLVSRLAAGSSNLCVVGDDDQSIYGWRGADIRNILEFERDFPNARVIRLERNYRSTANIINAAATVIDHNPGRMEKRMWTEAEAGARITVFCAEDERDEARFVVERIARLDGQRRDVAVFYRTNAQSRAIEEALLRSGIRYVIVGGTRFYERKEVKDLVAYLRFAANPDDDLSLGRIVNVPPRGIGAVTWTAVGKVASERGVSRWRVLCGGATDTGLSAGPLRRLRAFERTARGWIEGNRTSVTELLSRIIDDSGYLDYLAKSSDPDKEARIDNVRELLTVGQDFDEIYDPRELEDDDPAVDPLVAFLERLALSSEVDDLADERAGAVTLMTVHNSKGLEFDHVIMTGMEEGLFPHSRSTDESDSGVPEERRLCYVGMTRARKTLAMTHALRRHLHGTVQSNPPSRFLAELPPALVEAVGGADADRRAPAAPPMQAASRPSGAAARPQKAETRAADGRTYRVGMKVVHPMFGEGTIRACERAGNDAKLVVEFRRAGTKKLVARYARLQTVGG
ncbi:MAG: ATP-dependent DNA helicase PcrA [Deltaproteobacteria bacterium]|nr:MAG: ATP-dependent DNA helicase PcrA [Deltaproteobacteria bacterium]